MWLFTFSLRLWGFSSMCDVLHHIVTRLSHTSPFSRLQAPLFHFLTSRTSTENLARLWEIPCQWVVANRDTAATTCCRVLVLYLGQRLSSSGRLSRFGVKGSFCAVSSYSCLSTRRPSCSGLSVLLASLITHSAFYRLLPRRHLVLLL